MSSGALELDTTGSLVASVVIGIVLIAVVVSIYGGIDPLSFANSGLLQANLQELQ